MNWHFARTVGLPKFFLRQLLLRLHNFFARQPLRIRLPTGLSMNLPEDSFFGRDVYVTNADVDWGSEALFSRHLDLQGDFIDVGANIGYYSVYVAPVVRRVFSFDPDPRNHAPLAASSRESSNIIVQERALSSSSGEMKLELGDESSVSRLATNQDRSDGKTIKVPVTSLDEFVRSQGDMRVTGIKLDTEGHELPILQGGIEMIRRDQPLILTELMRWPGHGDEAFRELVEFAEALAYHHFAFVPQPLGWVRAGRFRLVALDDGKTFSTNATKMIFLVPERLHSKFVRELSETC
jgi:FkbM family methyltransferase